MSSLVRQNGHFLSVYINGPSVLGIVFFITFCPGRGSFSPSTARPPSYPSCCTRAPGTRHRLGEFPPAGGHTRRGGKSRRANPTNSEPPCRPFRLPGAASRGISVFSLPLSTTRR